MLNLNQSYTITNIAVPTDLGTYVKVRGTLVKETKVYYHFEVICAENIGLGKGDLYCIKKTNMQNYKIKFLCL